MLSQALRPGITYRSGNERVASEENDYYSFLNYFIATEIIFEYKEIRSTSQANSFYYLYQLIDSLICIAKDCQRNSIISTGEDIEIVISSSNELQYNISIYDRNQRLFDCERNKTQIISWICRHYSDVEMSITKCGIDVDKYLRRYPFQRDMLRGIEASTHHD